MQDTTRLAKPMGWGARRRPFGDTFWSCLLLMVLIFGGGAWAYFHFFQDRHLMKPTEGLLEDKEAGSEVQNIYRKKIRTDVWPRSMAISKRLARFINDVKAGKKYKDKSGEFDQEATEINNELREVITEVKARQIPTKYFKHHKSIAEAVGENYQALNYLRDYYYAETETEKENAWEKLLKVYKSGRGKLEQVVNYYGKP